MQHPVVVAERLDEIAALLSLSRAPRFRVKAYERAARVVRLLGAELGGVIERGGLQDIEGIGAALSRQVEELWRSGSSDYLSRLRVEHPPGAGELARVRGMTARRIRALHDALQLRSVAELRAACAAGLVGALPGFGERLEQRLLAEADHWLAERGSAPPPLARHHARELVARLGADAAPAVARVASAGALRRGEELVRGLDLVVAGDVGAALGRLARLRQVVRTDATTGRAALTAGVSLTLHAATLEDFGSALVAHTGSAAHVAQLVERARARGVALSLDDAGALPARRFASEEALYAALELPWIPPELRHGADEIGRAEAGELADLIAPGDLRGVVHCHTRWSDGKDSVVDMARAAHELGMEYITITDHSPSATYAGGVGLDRLQQQWDEIEAARERVPIRILKGTECDILIDGQLDYPDAVLDQFDVIIVSIHRRHRLDAAAMTARLTRALSLPIFKIWGHGLGRILNHRPPIDCDVRRVLDALAGSRGAVEINADPHRLDLPAEWLPLARRRGLPLVISVDAHSVRGLRGAAEGVTQARRAGFAGARCSTRARRTSSRRWCGPSRDARRVGAPTSARHKQSTSPS